MKTNKIVFYTLIIPVILFWADPLHAGPNPMAASFRPIIQFIFTYLALGSFPIIGMLLLLKLSKKKEGAWEAWLTLFNILFSFFYMPILGLVLWAYVKDKNCSLLSHSLLVFSCVYVLSCIFILKKINRFVKK